MAWLLELCFKPGGEVKKVWTRYNSYVLPDGRRVAMIQDLAWCFGCNGFAWAERLKSIEQIEETIQAWEDPESDVRNAENGKSRYPDQQKFTVDRELEKAYAYRDLLLVRTEPCHCTTCGSTEFTEAQMYEAIGAASPRACLGRDPTTA